MFHAYLREIAGNIIFNCLAHKWIELVHYILDSCQKKKMSLTIQFLFPVLSFQSGPADFAKKINFDVISI